MPDLVLAALLVAGFLLGFFRGAVRQLLGLGVWLAAFLIAAHARPAVGGWLGQHWQEYSRPYVDMLAFGMVFTALVVAGVLLVQGTGRRTTLTQREWLDNLLGGLLGAGFALLVIGSAVVILDTAYAAPIGSLGAHVDWLADLHAWLAEALIVRGLHEALLPGLGAILGPLLPADVRAVMG